MRGEVGGYPGFSTLARERRAERILNEYRTAKLRGDYHGIIDAYKELRSMGYKPVNEGVGPDTIIVLKETRKVRVKRSKKARAYLRRRKRVR